MDQKIGASRHNARTAPGNNPLSGSKPSAAPSLIVVVGDPDKETDKSEFLETTTTIKRPKDFCENRSCGSPWTIHHNPIALKMHIKSWFNYGKYGSVVNTHGPDVCNEVIQEYKQRWIAYKRKGIEIQRPGGVFQSALTDVLAGGEPRNEPQELIEAWSHVEEPSHDKQRSRDYGNQWMPCGCRGQHRDGCKYYRRLADAG